MCIHIHTHAHTHMHTYSHTYIHIQSSPIRKWIQLVQSFSLLAHQNIWLTHLRLRASIQKTHSNFEDTPTHLTLFSIKLCKLCKAHVIANPYSNITVCCLKTRNNEITLNLIHKNVTIKSTVNNHKVYSEHSRVSNMDKLLPGLSVSDSWKRIFPGTSMSKR